MEKVILLVSKYSSQSSSILRIINTAKVDFSFIDILYIDNYLVRKSIINHVEFDIKVVPTILVFSTNILKYEGVDAFKYINEHVI